MNKSSDMLGVGALRLLLLQREREKREPLFELIFECAEEPRPTLLEASSLKKGQMPRKKKGARGKKNAL